MIIFLTDDNEDYYSFAIDENHLFFHAIKAFIKKVVQFWNNPKVCKSSYFIVENNNCVMLANQNNTRIAGEWVNFIITRKD